MIYMPEVGDLCEVSCEDHADYDWVKIHVVHVYNGVVIGVVDMPGERFNGDIEKYSPGYNRAVFREIPTETAIAAQQPIAKFHSRTFPSFKVITVFEHDDSWVGVRVDGEAYHCYKRHWDIEFISEQPVWNGEGLPPVGCDVEFTLDTDKYSVQGNIPENGQVVNVVAHKETTDGNPVAVVYWDDHGSGRAAAFIKAAFGPIRTEAERKREEAISFMCETFRAIIESEDEKMTGQKAVFASFYDAISSGKIPGVRLSDD